MLGSLDYLVRGQFDFLPSFAAECWWRKLELEQDMMGPMTTDWVSLCHVVDILYHWKIGDQKTPQSGLQAYRGSTIELEC